ncbi:YitT family protein [[Brevibacterium] frigoritolerans]|nr:YitT family protein [Peribacillus frigoritolerans]
MINDRNKVNNFNLFKNYFLITLGAFIFAYGLESFLVPNEIIDGGIVGISMILAQLLGLPLGIFLLVLNLPFLFLGYKQIGKTFAFQSLYGITLASIFTQLLHHTTPLTKDPLLAAVFGGIIVGIGVGLVLRNSGSLDGSEIVAILISSKSPFSVGQIVLFINLFILSSAGFVFSLNSAMYSLITYFVAFKMIDIVVEGLDQSKSIWIISDKHQEIGDSLLSRLGRTVTYLNGEGAYSGEEKKIIFCVINRLEEAKLKHIVDHFDPEAFLAVGSVNDVKGGQFRKKNIH